MKNKNRGAGLQKTAMLFGLLVLFLVSWIQPGFARGPYDPFFCTDCNYCGCPPGIQCVTPKTPNDPNNPNDGPNVSGPNKDKSDYKSCDADFMNQIYSRAFLEGTRENVMNEIFIRKPDSVMEYSCFDQLAQLPGSVSAGPRTSGHWEFFSETDRWHNASVPINGRIGLRPVGSINMNTYMGEGRMTRHIEKLVLEGLYRYLMADWNKTSDVNVGNFAHKFLGGWANLDFSPTRNARSFACNYIDKIHTIAKCMNFNTDTEFWQFRELDGVEPRLLPRPCSCGTKIIGPYIDLAENKDFLYVNFDECKPTYLEAERPPTPCLPPIPTGVMVTRQQKTVSLTGSVSTGTAQQYPDAVCPNPSCSYTGTGRQCVP